ncbi:hypothetical protein BCR32DRAFT_245605 [Anaeromyces robustus]|uniref:Coth-domain-containing protein n=1 Tax=Anaeromyces robustus TaxID=1754192 RepID=A0A1Y1X4A6_9FUNG|nr:hypothetical protein BCR32DRAFT_245605 [Anaeromyces robustus]|eukprot:ORX80485.1 hypothetical protein BCR32DRAFT_245605 [Anaeromyces robustus]
MKIKNLYSVLGLLSIPLVYASRSEFYGDNDNRPELFKLLDDHIGTIKVNLDNDIWSAMKEKTQIGPWQGSGAEKFETKNATMEFFIEGTDYRVNLEPGQLTFELGGKGSRGFVKPGYNIKLEKGSIYDVKNLRIRANARDPTLMREKLSSDIIYKLGLPTTSTNYVNMEVNGEDLGLFIITNKVKKDFINRYFNDKKTNNLYNCPSDHNRFENGEMFESCVNSKDELADNKDDLKKFIDTINNAQSAEDIEKVLDVDQFLKSIVFEFLTLSWDHFLGYCHNFNWYKKSDGKWMMILNDFDETFGADYTPFLFMIYNSGADKSYIPNTDKLYIPNISLRDLDFDHKIIKYLVYDDDTRFRKVIGEAVKKVFNPKVLFNRIDEIADLIRDDITNSRSIGEETGYCKGCINAIGLNPQWNITHFEDGINYGNWNSNIGITFSPALKFFIEGRFKYICHTYGINPETLELIEPRPKVSFWGIKNKNKVSFIGEDFDNDPLVKYSYPDIDKEDFMQEEYNAHPEINNKPVGYEYPPFSYELDNDYDSNTYTDDINSPEATESFNIY